MSNFSFIISIPVSDIKKLSTNKKVFLISLFPGGAPCSKKTSRTTSRAASKIGRIRIKTTGVARGVAWCSGCNNFEDLEDSYEGSFQCWRNSNQDDGVGKRS
ncbi:hypothetical protein B9Z55_002640 [Caenorhabditis nigoni]|uniref:Uncharacterized protein n=1 Tax=Caenorhabditis nigoni TaxID=1611254 RepID=A0A2G5VLY0_9PELO|nr:hypothetical protein B9Z55_002640 [Caenorhabditis nigoni]